VQPERPVAPEFDRDRGQAEAAPVGRARRASARHPGSYVAPASSRLLPHRLARRDSTFISNSELVFPAGARYIVPALFSLPSSTSSLPAPNHIPHSPRPPSTLHFFFPAQPQSKTLSSTPAFPAYHFKGNAPNQQRFASAFHARWISYF